MKFEQGVDPYTYNNDLTIRTSDSIERYPQKTIDGNEIVVVYIDEVEYKNPNGEWHPKGFRWAVVEPYVTESEVYNWLMNNGLSSVPFVR